MPRISHTGPSRLADPGLTAPVGSMAKEPETSLKASREPMGRPVWSRGYGSLTAPSTYDHRPAAGSAPALALARSCFEADVRQPAQNGIAGAIQPH